MNVMLKHRGIIGRAGCVLVGMALLTSVAAPAHARYYTQPSPPATNKDKPSSSTQPDNIASIFWFTALDSGTPGEKEIAPQYVSAEELKCLPYAGQIDSLERIRLFAALFDARPQERVFNSTRPLYDAVQARIDALVRKCCAPPLDVEKARKIVEAAGRMAKPWEQVLDNLTRDPSHCPALPETNRDTEIGKSTNNKWEAYGKVMLSMPKKWEQAGNNSKLDGISLDEFSSRWLSHAPPQTGKLRLIPYDVATKVKIGGGTVSMQGRVLGAVGETITGVPCGEQNVTVQANGYASATAKAVVTTTECVVVSVPMTRYESVFVKVYGANDKQTPLKGADVECATANKSSEPVKEPVKAKTDDGGLAIFSLSPGLYTLSLSMHGYKCVTEPITVKSEPLSVKFALMPQEGTLLINATDRVKKTSVQGEVYNDAKRIGRTDENIALKPFVRHTIRIVSSGYNEHIEYIKLDPGQKLQQSVPLSPKPGYVRIIAQVQADVYEGQRRLGNTGEVIGLDSAVSHELQVRAEGYETSTFRLSVKAGKTNDQNIRLKPLPAELFVSVNVDAELTLDGERIAAEQRVIIKEVDKQHVLVARPSDSKYESETRIIERLKPGQKNRIAINLRSKPGAFDQQVDILCIAPKHGGAFSDYKYYFLEVSRRIDALRVFLVSNDIEQPDPKVREKVCCFYRAVGAIAVEAYQNDVDARRGGHEANRRWLALARGAVVASGALATPARDWREELASWREVATNVPFGAYLPFPAHEGFVPTDCKGPDGIDAVGRLTMLTLPSCAELRICNKDGGKTVAVPFVLVPDQMGLLRTDEGKDKPWPIAVPFYIGRGETTLSAMRCFASNASLGEGIVALPENLTLRGPGSRPFVGATPDLALSYCNWLSSSHGRKQVYRQLPDRSWTADFDALGYRLPTKEEWEYAARCGFDFGGGKSQLPTWDDMHASYKKDLDNNITRVDQSLVYFHFYNPKDEPRHDGDKAAGSYPLGMYNMCGNVGELCTTTTRTKIDGLGFVVMGGDFRSDTENQVMPWSSRPYGQGRADTVGLRVMLPVVVENVMLVRERGDSR
jgi:hypothetical protein